MKTPPICWIQPLPGVVILWLVAGILTAAAQQPERDSQTLSQRVDALVTLLADDDPAIRDDAERQLLQLGTDILSLLPRASSGATPDVKLRLARVRNKINRLDLEASIRPSRVVLNGEMTLAEALLAIESQTSNRVLDSADRQTDPSRQQTLALQLQNVTFWQAINTLLRESNSQLDAFSEKPHTLMLWPRMAPPSEHAEDRPLSASNSIVRGEVMRVALVKDWGHIPRDTLRVDVDLLWEPRLSPLELRFANKDLSAVDDLNNMIRPVRSTGQETVIITDRFSGMQRSWQFEVPPANARSLKSISTTVEMLLSGPVVSFSFSNLDRLQKPQQYQPGVTVTIEEVRQVGSAYEVRLLVQYHVSSPAFESHRTWIYDVPVFLTDQEGRATAPRDREVWLQRGSQLGLAFRFDVPSLEGQSLQFSTPRTFFLARIPIEFRDVPLP